MVQDAGLLLVAALLLGGLSLPGALQADGFHIAFYVHLALTLAFGRVAGGRRWTWGVLIVAWVMTDLSLLMMAARAFGHDDPAPAWLVLPIAALGADVVAAYARRPRPGWQTALGLAAAVSLAVVLGMRFGPGVADAPVLATEGPFTPLHIVPPWFTWPAYAVVRIVPSKLAGLALMLAAMLAFAAWRGVPGRWWQAIVGALVMAVWVGLGWFGGRSPEDDAIVSTRLLTALHFVLVLALPAWLRRQT